jgi:hypothetical protein
MRSSRGRGQNQRRRGIEILEPVMFSDAKHIEAHLVRERDGFEQLAQMPGGIDGAIRDPVNGCGDKTVYSNLHE